MTARASEGIPFQTFAILRQLVPYRESPRPQLLGWFVDLIENAAVTEVIGLCFGPSAKNGVIDRDQLDIWRFCDVGVLNEFWF